MTPTICAPATPQGGAIGIIRISGPNAITIANTIFSKDITNAPANAVIYGNIYSPANATQSAMNNESSVMLSTDGLESEACQSNNTSLLNKDNAIIDDVLLTVFRAPHSYTGEDSIEISCHGSSYIMNTILNLLVKQGCTMAEPGEFTQRAFLNGKMDLSQAEAVADLIASTSAAQHRVAMTQMRGAFSSELAQLSDKLLEMSSLLELELDFSEEDVEFADRQRLAEIAEAIEQKIQSLIASYRIGNVLKQGVPVAIIGAPNVGKSTLLNQLLHDERAIVSDIQGTTRDIIEDTVQIEGILFRFLDTAGIRHTDDKIEKMGIERSIRAVERAHIVIMLTEPGVPYPEVPLREDQTVIRIVNKTEGFQALTGKGIKQLEQQLVAALPSLDTTDIIVTSQRHEEALQSALQQIKQAHQSLLHALPGDLIAEDLRACIASLSTIIGRNLLDPQTTLNSIFSHFCIGK